MGRVSEAPGGLGRVSGRRVWGTEWGTNVHVAQPIPAEPDFANVA